jgi:hypothetical protein
MNAAANEQRDYDTNWTTEFGREFPRELDYEGRNVRFPIYRQPTFFDDVDVLPDPWCKDPKFKHSDIVDERDFVKKLKSMEKWVRYLNSEGMTITHIRDQTHSLTKTVEILGPRTPVAILKEYANFICKVWPNRIPTDEEGIKLAPSGNGATNVLKIYGRIIEQDLKATKSFIGWQKWANRRTKYDNFGQFAVIINQLAEELGPIAFGWYGKLQINLDIALTMKLYTIDNHLVLNEFTTSFQDWAFEMFSKEALYKKVRGDVVKIRAKIVLSEAEFDILMNKRMAMGPEVDTNVSTSSDSDSDHDSDINQNQPFSLSSHGDSSGYSSEHEIRMQQ